MTHQDPRTIAAERRAARKSHYRGKLLSVAVILERLGDENGPLPRRTWQQWRSCGKAPRCYKLPNGRVVCREDEFDRWLESLRDDMEVHA